MKVLILGSGGREHALGWGLRADRPDAELIFAPGNGGTHLVGRNVGVSLDDLPALVELARREAPAFTLVGPEQPLALGVVDAFRAAGLPIFGPTRRAAEIEASKVFSKALMRECGVPTAAFETFVEPEAAIAHLRRSMFPQVVKADGLAQGKGVYIIRGAEQGEAAIREILSARRFGSAGEQIVIESFLDGEEVSAFALVRGEEFQIVALARDHKRLLDHDAGPNTGGMGAVAPHPLDTPALRRAIAAEVFAPTLRALTRAGRPFQGLLYAGLMLVDGRPYALEYNCRFGDPETQAIVPLFGHGLAEALRAVATGDGALPTINLWREPTPQRQSPQDLCSILAEHSSAAATTDATAHPAYAATVVLASAGYPDDPRVGVPIHGLEAAAEIPETFIFHGGTRLEGGTLVTSGGRVLSVTGRGATPKTALSRAYDAVSLIEFEGKQHRRDIGATSIGR